MSVVLIQEKDGIQKPIYYVCQILNDMETRYLKLEKLVYILLIVFGNL